MNHRLKRVEAAKIGLEKIINQLHDARFDGGKMTLYLDDGCVFFVQGYTTRESFEKAYSEAVKEKQDGDNSV